MLRHSRRVVSALASLALAVPLASEAADTREEIRGVFTGARAARERKDYAAFLELSRRLLELAPRSTQAMAALARAEALSSHPAEAVALLDRLAGMGVAVDLAADPDLQSLPGKPGFDAVRQKMEALNAPVGKSTVAFTLPQEDLITEGIAHDPRTGAFFVSSIHRRKIVRVARDGTVRDFVGEGQDGLLSAVSLAVDAERRLLWASSGALPGMRGYKKEEEGRSFLVAYDLASGKLLRTIGPPAKATDARLGDLTVAPTGDLYVSDPESGRLYVLARGASELQVMVEAGTLGSPQGLAVTPDGRWLFVADYVRGIARIDPKSRSVSFLEAPDVALTGIDGLVLAGDSLVGIQNGIRPHKVLRLRLAPEKDRIAEVSTLEKANPHFDEPTLGVAVGRELFFVANSQWSHVRDDGTLDSTHLKKPVILRTPLDW
jgi:sugar lactone lactonase YvrE